MTEDFRNQIEAYSFPDNIKLTQAYISKYWLQKQEYLSKWKLVQNTIFQFDKRLPNMIIKPEFELLVRQGGLLFVPEEFELLKECIKASNDSSIILIEDYDELNPPHNSGPLLRFKYPVELSWDEINLGISEGISYELYHSPIRNFFVFGDSGMWGKYAANDFDYPVDIYCFKKEIETVFRESFKENEEVNVELSEILPLYFR